MTGVTRGEQQLLGGPSAIIAAAAHELKAPLTLMAYIADMLGDDTLALSSAERAQYVQRLRLVSKRTLGLLQHLTVSYRLEDADQIAFQFSVEPVNIAEVCEAALHELTPYAREFGQELRCANSGRAPLVVANRDILYDVVVNLIDNAVRHNAPGTPVTLTHAARGEKVRLAVHDNGAGISARELARLRQNLGQSPQPLSGHAGTSGLGLYIVSQLTQAMGGALGLGKARTGTTFFVDLLRSRQLSLLPL